MFLWASREGDVKKAHHPKGWRILDQWEMMGFARDEEDPSLLTESMVLGKKWGADPVLEWPPLEEDPFKQGGEDAGDVYDRFKRDIYYLTGWFARGQRNPNYGRCWTWEGARTEEKVNDLAAVSMLLDPS